jgi:hypothetical protein
MEFRAEETADKMKELFGLLGEIFVLLVVVSAFITIGIALLPGAWNEIAGLVRLN